MERLVDFIHSQSFIYPGLLYFFILFLYIYIYIYYSAVHLFPMVFILLTDIAYAGSRQRSVWDHLRRMLHCDYHTYTPMHCVCFVFCVGLVRQGAGCTHHESRACAFDDRKFDFMLANIGLTYGPYFVADRRHWPGFLSSS